MGTCISAISPTFLPNNPLPIGEVTDILPVCFVSYELDYQILDFLIYLTQKIVKKSNFLLILTISLK